MKTKLSMLLIIAGIVACSTGNSDADQSAESMDHSEHMEAAEATDSKPKSPKQMAMTNVGENHVHIEYSSPSKRGRQIFGGLVAFGEVWVTGAHKATSISFTRDVKIGDVNIEKGKYALFTIPGESSWTIIINRNWDQHLADDYDAAEDVVRLEVTPETLSEPVESLTYEVTELDENSGRITISWDTIAVSFDVENS